MHTTSTYQLTDYGLSDLEGIVKALEYEYEKPPYLVQLNIGNVRVTFQRTRYRTSIRGWSHTDPTPHSVAIRVTTPDGVIYRGVKIKDEAVDLKKIKEAIDELLSL